MLPISRRNLMIEENVKADFVGSLIGGLAGLGGGLLGYSAQNKAAEQAAQRADEALKYYEGLPEYEYLAGTAPILEQTPEELQAAMIQEDPTLRTTELQALQQMQELADKGMSAQDAYNYMQATNRAGTESRGQQEAIINEMQRKGAAGSGLEYALRTRAAQDAVDRFAENQALEAAKKAELQALANMNQAQMAGDIRGQDLNVSGANTNALNQFAMENSRNRQAVQQANVNRQNVAAQNELAARRATQQGNVELARNLAQQRANVKSGQQAFDLAGGIAKSNLYSDIGSTIGKAAGGIYDYYNKPKTEVK